MKKLFALLAVALGVVACQKDQADMGVNLGGEQEAFITVNLPEVSRAGSESGAFENGVLNTHDLRYILEIYYGENCYRQVQYTNEKSASFPVRLAPEREYKFAVWADFVTKGNRAEDTDLFYETSNGLDEISILNGAPMTEARDAFYGKASLGEDDHVANMGAITLTRPFAKIRVVTTDIEDLNNLSVALPTEATVAYDNNVVINNKFNALTGVASSDVNAVKDYTFNYANTYAVENGEMTLFADYLFVNAGATTKFTLNVTDHVTKSFNTEIPVVANQVTTIKGDILTNGSDIKVEIEDDFEQPGNEIEVVEVEDVAELASALENPAVGEIVLQENITLDGTLTFGAAATRANSSLPGRNITIDGNGNTLKVVKRGNNRVIDFTKETNGASLTLKNLTIENNVEWIERVINYNTNGTLTLENVKIVNTAGHPIKYAINLPSSSDYAQVIIKNSEIWANAKGLNLWGENTVANITDSKLYIVDQNPLESYSAITLNNDGQNAAHNSIINVEGGEIKVIYEGEGATMPSSAVGVCSDDSEVNISVETVVEGDIIYYAAIVTYAGTNEFYTFTSLQGAIDKAAESPSTATVALIKDIESSEIITVSGKATIDGNGHTITSTAGRAINVSGANDVTIKNLNIVASGERAINVIQNSKKVTIENVTATAANYTVNVANSAPGAVVAIKNSTLNGLCTVNVSSVGAQVTVDGSTVNCNDNNTTVGESYAALSLNKDAVGGSIIATNSTINVTEGSDSTAGRNGAEDGVVTIDGSVERVVVMNAAITYPGSDYYHAFPTIKAAIDFAESGNVISLIRNIELTEPLTISEGKVVLDLNGKTVTAPLFSAFEVKNGAELTIKNGKVVAYESTVRAIGGKAIIESGEYTSTGTAVDKPATNRYSLDCREGGELIINGGTFKSNNGMINVGSTVTINGGKFENIVEKTSTRHFAYVSALLTINDGEFYNKANASGGGCFFCGAGAGGDIQVKGGKFTSLWTSGSVNRIFEVYFGGSINVTGGMFNTNGGIASFVTANTDEATKAAYPYVAK